MYLSLDCFVGVLVLLIFMDWKVIKLTDSSFFFYGIEFFAQISKPEKPSIADIYFPKIGICHFQNIGPGGDMNVSYKKAN